MISVSSASSLESGASSSASRPMLRRYSSAHLDTDSAFAALAETLYSSNPHIFMTVMKDFVWMAINDDRIVERIFDEAKDLSAAYYEWAGKAEDRLVPSIVCLAAVRQFATLIGPDRDVASIYEGYIDLTRWLVDDGTPIDSLRVLEEIVTLVDQLRRDHGDDFTIDDLIRSPLYDYLSEFAERRARYLPVEAPRKESKSNDNGSSKRQRKVITVPTDAAMSPLGAASPAQPPNFSVLLEAGVLDGPANRA